MEFIELTVKSVEEAKAQAATQLGVEPEQVNVTVLEESKGLFGKVSLRVRAEVAAADSKSAKKGSKKSAKQTTESKSEEKAAPAAEEAKPAKGAKGKSAKKDKAAEAPAEPTETEESETADEPVATAEDAETLIGFARRIIEGSGLSAEVTLVGTQGKYVNMSIDGKDTSYFVGKHGEVLNQIQYLLNVISAQQLHNGVRVVLDGNDYRRKREDQLSNLANKIAAEVARRGEEAVLDALPAFERRIIHKTLADNPAVQTYSEGEEPNRRVVIAPAE